MNTNFYIKKFNFFPTHNLWERTEGGSLAEQSGVEAKKKPTEGYGCVLKLYHTGGFFFFGWVSQMLGFWVSGFPYPCERAAYPRFHQPSSPSSFLSHDAWYLIRLFGLFFVFFFVF